MTKKTHHSNCIIAATLHPLQACWRTMQLGTTLSAGE